MSESGSRTVRRRYIDDFFERHVPALPRGSRVLDLGGTRAAKRGRFDLGRFPVDPVYVNLMSGARPHVRGDAQRLPLATGSFDAAICAELLEHVVSPPDVLREVARVLRPSGRLLATVPFLYRIHSDPHDYGRYTDQYWRWCLARSGFEAIHVERQGAFHAVLADFLRQYLNHEGVPRPWGPFARRALAALERRATRSEGRSEPSPFLASFTTGFGIVAKKRGD